MKIVNLKVANIRPKYKNLKEWMDDENNVYIGRKGIVFTEKYDRHHNIYCYYQPRKVCSSQWLG